VLYRNEASFKLLRPLIAKTTRRYKTQKLKKAHKESSPKKGRKQNKTEKKISDSAEIATQVLVSSCVYNLALPPMKQRRIGGNLVKRLLSLPLQKHDSATVQVRKLAVLYSEEDRASSPTVVTGQTRFSVYPVSNRHSRMTGYCK
jgi:hypothetical protein